MGSTNTLNANLISEKWYSYWLKNRYFKSEPDSRIPYTIVIPPPNVTGGLHMGHMMNNTLQDVLVRRARMLGMNACWVPGTDHASIATEAKVVQKLADQGLKKEDLTICFLLNRVTPPAIHVQAPPPKLPEIHLLILPLLCYKISLLLMEMVATAQFLHQKLKKLRL